MMRRWKWPLLAWLCLTLAGGLRAQEELVPADLLREANQWLADNIDDDALDALGVDKDRVHRFLAEVQK